MRMDSFQKHDGTINATQAGGDGVVVFACLCHPPVSTEVRWRLQRQSQKQRRQANSRDPG